MNSVMKKYIKKKFICVDTEFINGNKYIYVVFPEDNEKMKLRVPNNMYWGNGYIGYFDEKGKVHYMKNK